MKLPRDVSGSDLARKLAVYGYQISRQTGSHIRLTTSEPAQHHITIPAHDVLKVGTLSAILADVATHAKLTSDAVKQKLFG